MKKVILVDGNNLLFRSYYATAYTGNMMKNSKGFPTNALYGFNAMMNKIINEEKPTHIMVAFDIGKNFRLEKYEDYKAGRSKTPDELKVQMPYARKLLEAMHIKYFELEPYEADDIIGTFAKFCEIDPDFEGTIISSDKDLLQLISPQIDVKLLKQKDYIRYNRDTFYEDYLIEPIRIIDMKAIAGDPSDNIPGVKGIGDKGALTLLQKYETLENIYEHIDEITGKTKEKLITSKEDAFMSKEIATIYKDVPITCDLEELAYLPDNDQSDLMELYQELEFYSLIKRIDKKSEKKEVEEKAIPSEIDNICSYYLECDNGNYHEANIIGASITDKFGTYYFNKDEIHKLVELINNHLIYTYDEKKNICLLNKIGLKVSGVVFDTMIATYLLDYNTSDDIYNIASIKDFSVNDYNSIVKHKISNEDIRKDILIKSKFIFETHDDFVTELKRDDMFKLYEEIEHPLIKVLAKMELNGVIVNKDTLDDMSETIGVRIELLAREIYNMAGMEFNIASPKQLGDILFNTLNLPDNKKHSTDVKVLQKLSKYHPIIEKILEYRNLNKLKTTYLDGLKNYIYPDHKIHTIFKQGLTRTGRLSSVNPNLQNIPIKDEEGRKIRKAFVPETNHVLLSIDYSQIELRILAHISNCQELIDAFNEGLDIHTAVASDIYGVPIENVSKKMRSTAKAVIFGIVYGISGFGLGENLKISPKEAKEFIDKYYQLYPGVKKYMDNIIKEAYEEGSVRTLFNRKRVIDELNNTNYMVRQGGERIALNTPIQGTSADIIKKAMIDIDNYLEEINFPAKMLIQVHDELIFDVSCENVEELIKIVKDKMEHVIPLSVPLKVEASYGTDWYEAK